MKITCNQKQLEALLEIIPKEIKAEGIKWIIDWEEINSGWWFCRRFYKPKSWVQRLLRKMKFKVSVIKIMMETHKNCEGKIHLTVTTYTSYVDAFCQDLVGIRSDYVKSEHIESSLHNMLRNLP